MQNQTHVTDLDQIFKIARDSEPDLTDSNFTKVVLNRLPAKPAKSPQRQWLPDLIGMLVAVCAIWVLVEPANFVQNLMANLPDSIVISTVNVLIVGGVLIASALMGWWVVEKDS